MKKQNMYVLIVSGISGAGFGSVSKIFENIGWIVLNNIPAKLCIEIMEDRIKNSSEDNIQKYKFLLTFDSRLNNVKENCIETEEILVKNNIEHSKLFIDASNKSLIKRFENIKTAHPLQKDISLESALDLDRSKLEDLKKNADVVLDTSELTNPQLKKRIESFYTQANHEKLSIIISSFGFKNGIPIDANMLLDVRFLPNPFWVEELSSLSGLEKKVSDYVMQYEDIDKILDSYYTVVDLVSSGLSKEGKKFLTLAIGCTGGKHRSVAIVEKFKLLIESRTNDYIVHTYHRDLELEGKK